MNYLKKAYTNILFKTMMELNNIYYLNNYHNYLITYTSWKNLTTYIIDKLDKTSEACKLLMDPKIYNQKYLSNNVDLYDYKIQADDKDVPWPDKESLKKGICMRTRINFAENNDQQDDMRKMRVPEINGVPYEKKWDIGKNWLSKSTSKQKFCWWMVGKISKACVIGGVTHELHPLLFSMP